MTPPRGLAGGVRAWVRPPVVLAAVVAAYSGHFLRLLLLRHGRFATFDYDLGIWDQYVWLWAHGEGFNTIRGLQNLAFHVSPSLVVFVPFYWLGAGPNLLNAAMVASVAAGAVPVYRLGRRLLDDEWVAVVLAAVYLGHFSLQWQLWETFHPETLAIGPLLFGYEALHRRRWVSGVAWLALAVGCKEDIALAVAAMGLVVALQGQRRRGVLLALAAAAWFVVATQVLMPRFTDVGVFYRDFYGHLGDDTAGLVDTAVTNPTAYTRQLEDANLVGYVRDLLLGYGFVPLLAPSLLLIGLPQVLANLLSAVSNSWPVRVHYAAVPVAAMALAMVHGVARVGSASVRRALVGWTAAACLATSAAWGISRFSVDYDQGFWPLTPDPVNEVRRDAIDVVPGDAAVAASYNLVPHLAHRSRIYTFPNPFREQNWGVRGEGRPDPDVVEWLVVDDAVTDTADADLLAGLVDDGVFEVVTDEAGIVVARRVPEGDGSPG